MADAGIGDEAFHVVLGEGEHRAIEDADDAERHGHRREGGRRRGEKRDGETQQTVGAGLQKQAGENDAAGGRRLGMSIGQPGMKRHDGQLHGEGDEEAEHEPHLRRRAELRLGQREIVECQRPRLAVVDERECDDGGEHQQSASLGEQEELDRRVDPPLVPPDGDQEVHGNEHQFPEEEEQEEIERQEDADDARQGQASD